MMELSRARRCALVGAAVAIALVPALSILTYAVKERWWTGVAAASLSDIPMFLLGYGAFALLASPIAGAVGAVGGLLLSWRAGSDVASGRLAAEATFCGAVLTLTIAVVLGGTQGLIDEPVVLLGWAIIGGFAGYATWRFSISRLAR